MPRTVCSGLVGSVPLEELQVWPFDSNDRMEMKKKNENKKLHALTVLFTCRRCTFNVHVQGNVVPTVQWV